MASERLPEVEVGGVIGREEAPLALDLFRDAPRRKLDAPALRQDLQGLRRLETVLLLEPGEDVPAFAAPEALVRATVRIDVKGRRLLTVEGTEADEAAARLLQAHALADQLDDIDALFDEIEVPGHQGQYRARLASGYKWLQTVGMKIEANVSRA